MSLSNKSYEELEKASQDWAEWHKKVIILDEGRKATFSKVFLKHKLDSKSITEAEHKSRVDEEYTKIVKDYANAEEELINFEYSYTGIHEDTDLKHFAITRN